MSGLVLFNWFINYLEGGVNSEVARFAGDTELFRMVKINADCEEAKNSSPDWVNQQPNGKGSSMFWATQSYPPNQSIPCSTANKTTLHATECVQESDVLVVNGSPLTYATYLAGKSARNGRGHIGSGKQHVLLLLGSTLFHPQKNPWLPCYLPLILPLLH